MSVRLAIAGGLGLIIAIAARSDSVAHTGGSTGYATLTVDRATIQYTLTLWPATLPPAIGEDLRRVRADDAATRDRVLASLRDKVVLVANGQRCNARTAVVAPAAAESIKFVLDFLCAADVGDLLVHDDLFDVFGAEHHTLARVDAAGRTWQFAFTPEMREGRVRVDGASSGSGWGSFVRLGVEHILTGYDHLLFLLGLMLPGGGALALAKIITAFTLAHSVTLSLAVLDIVVLPERLIEAVIALSIAAVAAENLFRRATVTRRWVVSFGFGLVHGFGFSAALREMGLPAHGLLRSLFGFNLGVELGQVLVVAAALPVLVAIRRAGYERRVVWGSSMAILLVAVVLFVERALL
jgi:hypothetical protein